MRVSPRPPDYFERRALIERLSAADLTRLVREYGNGAIPTAALRAAAATTTKGAAGRERKVRT